MLKSDKSQGLMVKRQVSAKRLVIISLGGSIIVPDEIDTNFLKAFSAFVRRFVKNGYKFVIITGGGKPARVFQAAASKINNRVTDEDRDWVGIAATKLNAHLLRAIFRDIAHPEIIESYDRLKASKYPVTVGCGIEPGWSSDYDTVRAVINSGAGYFINAGKPDHVYDSDPHVNKNAKKFSNLTWREYRNIIPKKWSPGLSSPIDPVAAKLCEKKGIKAVVLYGRDLTNLAKAIEGKKFSGTTIQ